MEKLGNISLVQISQVEVPEVPSHVQAVLSASKQSNTEAPIPDGFLSLPTGQKLQGPSAASEDVS